MISFLKAATSNYAREQNCSASLRQARKFSNMHAVLLQRGSNLFNLVTITSLHEISASLENLLMYFSVNKGCERQKLIFLFLVL